VKQLAECPETRFFAVFGGDARHSFGRRRVLAVNPKGIEEQVVAPGWESRFSNSLKTAKNQF
jgi:hypothetical protein